MRQRYTSLGGAATGRICAINAPDLPPPHKPSVPFLLTLSPNSLRLESANHHAAGGLAFCSLPTSFMSLFRTEASRIGRRVSVGQACSELAMRLSLAAFMACTEEMAVQGDFYSCTCPRLCRKRLWAFALGPTHMLADSPIPWPVRQFHPQHPSWLGPS
jgi:hypothetical protein